MAWSKVTSHWNFNLQALARRFPYAASSDLKAANEEPIAISRVIAKTHDLTEPEAREELENFLDLQSLARDAADLRSRDAAMIAAD